MIKLLILLCSSILLSNCATMTNLQSAHTAGAGKVEYGVAYAPIAFTDLDSESMWSSVDIGNDNQVSFQTIEGFAKIGLTNHLDLYAKLYPIGIQFGSKAMFYDKEKITMAGDIALAWYSSSSSSSSDSSSTTKTKAYEFYPTYLFTYNVTDWLYLTAAPKARLAYTTKEVNNIKTSEFQHHIGGSINAMFNIESQKAAIVIEFGKYFGSHENISQFGFSVVKHTNLF